MKLRNCKWCGNVARIALLLISFTASGAAQERKAATPYKPSGNGFSRFFYGNYATPWIRSFEERGEARLESLIKDGILELSEADAVQLALESNVDINVDRYSPYFSLWGVDKSRAVLNPAVSFTTNVDRLVTPSSSLLGGADTLLNLTTVWDLTFQKPFEPGLDLALDFRTRRARSNNFFASLNPAITPALSLTLTQHLLKDFGRISRGRHLRIARNNYSLSQEDFLARTTETVANVLNVYWDLVYLEEDIKVKQASKKLAEVVLEQNKIQSEVGTMAPLDVVQAEAEVAARDEALVTAQYNKRIVEDQLKKLISGRPDPGLIAAAVRPTSKPLPPPDPAGDLEGAIRRALEVRPEVRRQQLDQENRKIQVDYTRNQLRPVFDVSASFSQNGLGGDRIVRDLSKSFFDAPILEIQRGGFWDSMDSLFSRKYLGYAIGFNLRVPLGNDDARANSAMAQIDYKQGEERLRSLRQRIAVEVRQAYSSLEKDRARVRTAEITVGYQEKRLQGEQDKYAMGATITRFILEAQRDLQDAQSRLLRAKIDAVKSRIAVDKSVGDLLGAYNIELQDALRTFK